MFRATEKILQYSVHPVTLVVEICNEYAAQTMFCQSQAYPTENKPEKARFFWLFYFQKKPKVFKKAKLATLLQKNWKRAWSTQENFQFFVIYRCPENLDIMKCLNASLLKTAVLSSCNTSITLQNLVMQPIRSARALINHTRQNKDNYFG